MSAREGRPLKLMSGVMMLQWDADGLAGARPAEPLDVAFALLGVTWLAARLTRT